MPKHIFILCNALSIYYTEHFITLIIKIFQCLDKYSVLLFSACSLHRDCCFQIQNSLGYEVLNLDLQESEPFKLGAKFGEICTFLLEELFEFHSLPKGVVNSKEVKNHGSRRNFFIEVSISSRRGCLASQT